MSQQHIDEGFLVAVHSTQGSRFKLLLFEEQEDSKWELLLQVGLQPCHPGEGIARGLAGS